MGACNGKQWFLTISLIRGKVDLKADLNYLNELLEKLLTLLSCPLLLESLEELDKEDFKEVDLEVLL
jgi:hypothetical protein